MRSHVEVRKSVGISGLETFSCDLLVSLAIPESIFERRELRDKALAEKHQPAYGMDFVHFVGEVVSLMAVRNDAGDNAVVRMSGHDVEALRYEILPVRKVIVVADDVRVGEGLLLGTFEAFGGEGLAGGNDGMAREIIISAADPAQGMDIAIFLELPTGHGSDGKA
jgi:hypothetical protein